jgi:FixJ family two-component response regulator/putative methionine-R-sulfoxide reductase with GAF domain
MMLTGQAEVVFILDDDASVRESLRSLLTSVGLYAEVFPSTEEFTRFSRPEIASCLVLDVRLPGMSGLEFQGELAQAGIDVPIVFITAHANVSSTLRAFRAGAVEFLSKPFQKEELLAAIHKALDRDRLRRRDKSEVSALRTRVEKLATREREIAVDIALLNKMARRLSCADPVQGVLSEVIEFVSTVVPCDSCFLYVLEDDDLVLRASKNSHPESVNRLKLKIGQGITGWVAQHREPVAVAQAAYEDPRFQLFNELPEDRFEAFLSVPLVSGGRLVGVLNLQNRTPQEYSQREVSLVATAGILVGAEVERARLESENSKLSERLETRKIVERAKGVLQRDLKLTEEQAFLALQAESRQRRKSMKEIAEAVLLSDELRRRAR